MIKLTSRNKRVPLLAAAAAAAILAAGHSANAAVDERITVDASQAAKTTAIEDMGALAADYAGRIGRNDIKLNTANVQALANILSDEIQAKTAGPDTLGTKDPNRDENKADEIAEMTGLIASGISSNIKIDRKGAQAAFGLAKGTFTRLKKNKEVQGSSTPNIFEDVAGSIMLSFVAAQGTSAATDKAIFKFLKLNVAGIVGAKKERQTLFKTGLKNAFKGEFQTASLSYEDGTLGPIIDPETDTRNG